MPITVLSSLALRVWSQKDNNKTVVFDTYNDNVIIWAIEYTLDRDRKIIADIRPAVHSGYNRKRIEH